MASLIVADGDDNGEVVKVVIKQEPEEMVGTSPRGEENGCGGVSQRETRPRVRSATSCWVITSGTSIDDARFLLVNLVGGPE